MSCLCRMCRMEGGLAGPKLESRVSLIPEPRLRGQHPRAGKQTLLLGQGGALRRPRAPVTWFLNRGAPACGRKGG